MVVGLGMDWILLLLGTALGVMLPGGALWAPALVLFLSPGNAQTVNFDAAGAHDTLVASVPALHGDPEIECPRCDTLFGRLAKTELGTNVQDVRIQVRDGQVFFSLPTSPYPLVSTVIMWELLLQRV